MNLVPYVQIDGEWTIPDRLMEALWQKTAADRLHELTFYDGSIVNAGQFLEYMKSDKTLPVIALDHDGPHGFAWLTEIGGVRAFGHFCMMRDSWGESAKMIADQIINYWWSLAGEKGPILQLIMGLTPEWNKPAVRFIKKLGFTVVGTIPRICNGKDGLAPGVLSYIERPSNG